jgi:recombination protein RecR
VQIYLTFESITKENWDSASYKPYFRVSVALSLEFNSSIVEKAVNALSSFPGIGKRTALRLVMYLLKRPDNEVAGLAESLLKLKTDLQLCTQCGNVCDSEVCSICSNPGRRQQLICVVEDFSDQMAIEGTAQFTGVYHILGGLIAPIDGIGPEQLNIEGLISRVNEAQVEEVILAFSATVEGDTTMFYIAKKLRHLPVKISCIARGIAVGGELEYADEITLGRSIMNRTEYRV